MPQKARLDNSNSNLLRSMDGLNNSKLSVPLPLSDRNDRTRYLQIQTVHKSADLDLGVLAASHSGVINGVYFDVKVTAKRGNKADRD